MTAHPAMRQHLDFAVDAVDDLEVALKGLAFVARDGAVVAFGEHHPRERADGFLDDVAARRQHGPLRVGERLAPGVVDQLERDDRGAMADDNVGELRRLNAHVGSHHGVAVAIVRDDVIGALGQQHDIARHDVLRDRATVAGVELAAGENVESNLSGRDADVTDAAFDANTAGRNIQHFANRVGPQLHRFGSARHAQTGVNNVIARRQHEGRRRRPVFLDQPQDAGGVGFDIKNPPDQAAADRRRVVSVTGRDGQRHLPGGHHRHRLNERWRGRHRGWSKHAPGRARTGACRGRSGNRRLGRHQVAGLRGRIGRRKSRQRQQSHRAATAPNSA